MSDGDLRHWKITYESRCTLQQVLPLDNMGFLRHPQDDLKGSLQTVLRANTDNIDNYTSGDCEAQIKDLFKAEISKSDHGHAVLVADSDLLSGMERVIDPTIRGPRYKIAVLLKALWFCGKVQNAFFSVFMQLCEAGLVTFGGVKVPYHLQSSKDQDVCLLQAALGCFEEVRKITRDWEEHVDFQAFLQPLDGYQTPSVWLATMIVRGAITQDFSQLMNKIEELGHFGRLDRVALEEFWPRDKHLVRNQKSGIIQPLTGNRDSPVVAFWLPHSMGEDINGEGLYKAFVTDLFEPLENLAVRSFNL